MTESSVNEAIFFSFFSCAVHTESLIVVDAPLDVQKVPHRRNKVQLSADSKSAVREGLELRHPTGTPEWFYT